MFCESEMVWISKRPVVRIWKCLVLLAGLSLGINRGYWDVFAFYFGEPLPYGDAWLPGIERVESVLYLPTIVQAVPVSVRFLPISPI